MKNMMQFYVAWSLFAGFVPKAQAGPNAHAPLCSKAWKETECPIYCTHTLKDLCCKYHSGNTNTGGCSTGSVASKASMLMPNMPHNLAVTNRAPIFKNCTGGEIELVLGGQGQQHFGVLYSVGLEAAEDANGIGIYDSYMVQMLHGSFFVDKADDLSKRIKQSPLLDWQDIFFRIRTSGAMTDAKGNIKQVTMPYDNDYVSVALREDLLAKYTASTGKEKPFSWEELADMNEYWQGKDLNNDNVPDYGLCSVNGGAVAGPNDLFLAILATKLQYKGGQGSEDSGIFFDTKTFEPLFDNAAFKEALKVFKRLWMHSVDEESGDYTHLHDTLWRTGRCSTYIWLTGSVTLSLTHGKLKRTDANGNILWQPEYPAGHPKQGQYWYPRRTRPFGSYTVFDRSSQTMKKCTPEAIPGPDEVTCPFLDPLYDRRASPAGTWLNRCPYFSPVFQHGSIAIRDGAPEEKKQLLWDFMVYSNVYAAPVVAQQVGFTYLDPFRASQLQDKNMFVDGKSEWNDEMFEDLKADFTWAGTTPNGAIPLMIPANMQYTHKLEKTLWQYLLPVGTDCVNKDDCKCLKFEGGMKASGKLGTQPFCGWGWGKTNMTVWNLARAPGGCKDCLTENEAVKRLTADFKLVTAQAGGKKTQLAVYRRSLLLPALTKDCKDGEYFEQTVADCASCTLGYYCERPAPDEPSERKPCGEGTHAPITGLKKCQKCAGGRYAASVRMVDCIPCALGQFQATTGSNFCDACPIGEYQNTAGKSVCNKFGVAHVTTAKIGATSTLDAACKAGYYHPCYSNGAYGACTADAALSKLSEGFCSPCPGGMVCAGLFASDPYPIVNARRLASTQIHAQPEAKSGFMALRETPNEAWGCRGVRVCPGGPPGTCSGGFLNISRGCAECPADSFTNDGLCSKCDGSKALLYIVAIAVLVFWPAKYWQTNKPMLRRMEFGKVVSLNLLLLLSLGQFASVISALAIQYPSPGREATPVSELFAFDFNLLRVECVFPRGSVDKFLFRVSLPAVLSVYWVFCFIASQVVGISKPALKWTLPGATNGLAAVLQALFLSIVSSATVPFQCTQQPNGAGTLVAYPDVICGDSDQKLMMVPAVLSLLIFGVGFVAVSVWAVFVAPAKSASSTTFVKSFQFLFFTFRADRWYWGPVRLMRNILLSFLPVVSTDDPQMALCYGLCVVMVYLTFELGFWPWGSYYLNTSDAVITVAMSLIAAAAMALSPPSPAPATFMNFIMAAIFLVVLAVVVGCVLSRRQNLEEEATKFAKEWVHTNLHCNTLSSENLQNFLMKCSETEVAEVRRYLYTIMPFTPSSGTGCSKRTKITIPDTTGELLPIKGDTIGGVGALEQEIISLKKEIAELRPVPGVEDVEVMI